MCVCVFIVETMISEISGQCADQGIDAQNKLQNIKKHQAIMTVVSIKICYYKNMA